jgi:hypothetical protein
MSWTLEKNMNSENSMTLAMTGMRRADVTDMALLGAEVSADLSAMLPLPSTVFICHDNIDPASIESTAMQLMTPEDA